MSLKIFMVLHVVSQARHFTTVYQELIRRGHQVIVQVEHRSAKPLAPPGYLEPIPELRLQKAIMPRGFWGKYAKAFRATHNYLLYAHPKLASATVFRSRAYAWTDPFLRRWLPERGSPPSWLVRFLNAVERAIPPAPQVTRVLQDGGYDLVLVSPLIFYQSLYHHDYVKAARAVGVPVGFPVFSWDNLSTKGTLQVMPDRIWVWNEAQRRELDQFHNVTPERVGVMGAWRFDEFRALPCAITREEFCRRAGLDPAAAIITYLGSSTAIAPDEGAFVEKWLAAVRASPDPAVRNANIVVRAHPRNLDAWKANEALKSAEGVYFQEPGSTSFWDTQELHDLLAFSHVCVGVNTSAMLEAAIMKRPVFTVRDEGTKAGHEGTVHFEYLTEVGGGLLYRSQSLEAHVPELSDPLRRELSTPDPRAECFCRAFIDEGSDDRTPTERLADEIETLAATRPAPLRRNLSDRMLAFTIRVAVGLRLLRLDPDREYPGLTENQLVHLLQKRAATLQRAFARVDASGRLEAYLVRRACRALGYDRDGPLSIDDLPLRARIVGRLLDLSITSVRWLFGVTGMSKRVAHRLGPLLVHYRLRWSGASDPGAGALVAAEPQRRN